MPRKQKFPTIHYGFGKDYLTDWGIQQALREVYQNFLDYGDWEDSYSDVPGEDGLISVTIVNGWHPENLEYLRIGRSQKENDNAIGKHGEGLKMAFLIFKRMGLSSYILTPDYEVWPEFYEDKEIGECFCFRYDKHMPLDVQYTVGFTILKEDFLEFKRNLITESDVIYSHYRGDIVNKPAGRIYSGGLFVCELDNMSKAYNIKPQYLPLDRDRCVPKAFDVSYESSMINDAYGKYTARDLNHSDNMFSTNVPVSVKEELTPRLVGDSIEFTYVDNGEEKVLTNTSVKEALKNDGFFANAIKKLKAFVAKKLGLYDMLLQFKSKHRLYGEALQDFELIIERVKQ